jgi:hypothetical protein
MRLMIANPNPVPVALVVKKGLLSLAKFSGDMGSPPFWVVPLSIRDEAIGTAYQSSFSS